MDITISSILIFVATFFGLFVSIFYLLTTFSPNKKEFSKKIKYLQKKVINKFLEKRLKIGKRKGST